MLILINKLISKYNLKIKGIIHIGAHWGQEFYSYCNIGIKNLMFFEPVKSNYENLLMNVPQEFPCYNMALGNIVGEIEMFIENTNSGMSCSILEPQKHKELYPYIIFDKKEIVRIDKLDNLCFNRKYFNMINIDVQGYELEVFKGAKRTLRNIDIIYTEVNTTKVYKDCALIGDIDDYLSRFGFKRIDVFLSCSDWGDAIYLK